jgi:hypothetical protein
VVPFVLVGSGSAVVAVDGAASVVPGIGELVTPESVVASVVVVGSAPQPTSADNPTTSPIPVERNSAMSVDKLSHDHAGPEIFKLAGP